MISEALNESTQSKNNENSFDYSKEIIKLEKELENEISELDNINIEDEEIKKQQEEINSLTNQINSLNPKIENNKDKKDKNYIDELQNLDDLIKEQLSLNFDNYEQFVKKEIEEMKNQINNHNIYIKKQFQEILNSFNRNENSIDVIKDQNQINNDNLEQNQKDIINQKSNDLNKLFDIKINLDSKNENNSIRIIDNYISGPSDNTRKINELKKANYLSSVNQNNEKKQIKFNDFLNSSAKTNNTIVNNNTRFSLNKKEKDEKIRIIQNIQDENIGVFEGNDNKINQEEKYGKKNKIFQSINNIFFYDYEQKYIRDQKINEYKIEELKKEIFNDKIKGKNILKNYYMNYIEEIILPLFNKNKKIITSKLEIIKYNISIILECLGMNNNYYNNYYSENEKKKKNVNRRQSQEAVVRFRNEFKISEEDFANKPLEDKLIENNLDIYKTFGKLFG